MIEDKTYEQAKQETNEKYKDVFAAIIMVARDQGIPLSEFLDKMKADIEHGCTVKIQVDKEEVHHYSVIEPKETR